MIALPSPSPAPDTAADGDADIAAYTLWEKVRRRLERERRRVGVFTTASIASAAEELGVGARTLWRWLSVGGPPATRRFELTERHLILIATHKRVKLAWKAALKEGLEVDYTTFWRAWRRLPPSVRKGLPKGIKAMRVEQVYGKYPARKRNGVWQADHTLLPIWIRPKRGKKPVKVWLTAFIDVATRVAVAFAITTRQPNAELVIATLVDGILGVTLTDGTFVGGKPRTTRFDRGADFEADLVADASKTLAIIPNPCEPYKPFQKPHIERLMGIVVFEFLAGLPGVGQVLDHRQKLPYREAPESLLTFEELYEVLRERFEHYNAERPHSSLGGRTPYQAWRDDETPIERVDGDQRELGVVLIRRNEWHTVNQNGIRFRNVDYVDDALSRYRRQRLQIGFIEHDPTFIWVYVDGKPYCRCVPPDHLTVAQIKALVHTRDREIATVRRIRLGATKLAEANGTRDPDADPVDPPLRPRRAPSIPRDAAADAILDDAFGDPATNSEVFRS
jgi:putative transposase